MKVPQKDVVKVSFIGRIDGEACDTDVFPLGNTRVVMLRIAPLTLTRLLREALDVLVVGRLRILLRLLILRATSMGAVVLGILRQSRIPISTGCLSCRLLLKKLVNVEGTVCIAVDSTYLC